MGTGKTTAACAIRRYTGAGAISSDEVRKELAGIPPTQSRYVRWGTDIYTPEFSARTHEEMRGRARDGLTKGDSVILEASYRKKAERQAVYDLAREMAVPFVLIETVCSEEVIKERLDIRMREGTATSDGRWDLYDTQKTEYDPVEEVSPSDHITLDTSGSQDEVSGFLLRELYRRQLQD